MDKKPDSPALDAAFAASHEADLNPLPQATAAPPALVPEPPPEPELDAHGFDPAEYKWLPVKRVPRKDGWTPQRQRDFIAALAETGCVEQAAQAVSMTARSAYRLRSAPGAEAFAAAWDAALHHAARKLVDLAFDRAIHGTDEPVFDREGRCVGRRMRQNDRLLMFLLRAYMPERFRHAHRDAHEPGEPLPRPEPPVGQMLERLAPVPPAEPHRLLPPDELEDALLVADLLGNGELPHYHRGRGDAEPPRALDPVVEAELEAAMREPAGGRPKPANDTDEDPFLG